MKRLLLPIFTTLFIFSCKEQPVGVILEEHTFEDTTYVTTPPSADPKMYLLEELTGVRCVNCPQGAEALEQMNIDNNMEFVIIGLHTGALTAPISGKSIQDFRTPIAAQIVDLIFGGQSNKPSVAFNRLPISSGSNPYFVDGMNNWPAAINQMKAHSSTSPFNLEVTSEDMGDGTYKIHAKVTAHQEVNQPVNLHIVFTENEIWDGFIGSDTLIRYDHVLRTSITGAQGKPILRAFEPIEAGRVYELNTSLSIDPTDEKQALWKQENMKIVVFVSNQEGDQRNIIQAKEINLK